MSSERKSSSSHSQVGRYALFDVIATGGMASVYLGRLDGAVGFSRVVAIKRLHQHLALDPDFRDMFLTEARIAARIRHPNVVQTFDVVASGDDVSLVMEYVQGESLSWLERESSRLSQVIPLNVAASVIVNMLHGLHAAHEACDEHGAPLAIVHRDVSPQNVMVGADGVARVFDFGVARALQSTHQTRAGQVKGKVSYMAPEQIRAGALDRRADVFAAGVVLWELLAGQRLFFGPTDAARIMKVLEGNYPSPALYRSDLPPTLTEACMKALAFDPSGRFATALDFADAIERATPLASQRTVGEWLNGMAAASLNSRAALVKQVETSDIYSSLSAVVADAARPSLRTVSEEPAAAATQPTAVQPAQHRKSLRLGALLGAASVVAVLGGVLALRGPSTSTTASAAASGAPLTSAAPVVTAASVAPPAVEAAPSASAVAAAPSASASAKAPKRTAPAKPVAGPHVGTTAARKFRPTEL